jgi:hypothetical protein
MKNKLLLPLLGLLVVSVVILWRTGGDDDAEPGEPPVGLAPGESALVAGQAAVEALPEVLQPQSAGADREEVVAMAEGEVEMELPRRAAPPSNAVWISGRVIFPDRMPDDGGELMVTARGRRFGDLDSRREHTVSVARDGTFRVAFSKETKKGWVDLRGRYLYMDERLRVDFAELPDEVVLEPSLGGVVRGVAKAPPGCTWTEAARDGARAVISRWWVGGDRDTASEIDAEGRFELLAVPPKDSLWVRLELPLWCDAAEGEVTIEPGEVTDITLELEAGSTLLGRVVSDDDAGLAAVPIELSGRPRDGTWMRDAVRSAADGSFVFRGVKDGEVTLKAAPPHGLPVTEELGLVSNGSRREGIVLRVDMGNFIEGIVRWPDGRPVSNADISVSQDRESNGLMFNFSDAITGNTDSEGNFHITGLEPSVCQVRAQAKSFRAKELAKAEQRAAEGRNYTLRARGPLYKTRVDDVYPGTSGLVLVLGEGSQISGRAVDDQGEGLTRFLLNAEPVEGSGDGLEDEDAVRRIVVSLDGSFTVDGLQEGTWLVTAKAKDYEITPEVVVTLPGSGEIELVANRFAQLSGVVRSPKGEPVSGARVFIERLDEDEAFELEKVARQWGESATTNQSGAFTARDVRPGRLRVSADGGGYGSSQGIEVHIEPGAELGGVGITLRRPARIRGQLHASVGDLDGRRIRLRVEGGGSFRDSANSDSAGAFEFDGLDAGTYRLALQQGSPDPDGFVGREVVEVVDVNDGQELSLVLGAPPSNPTTVTGRVFWGTGPATGVVVRCRSTEDADLDNDAVRTDGEGRYNLTLRGTGRYSFEVGNPSRGMTSSDRDLVAGQNPGVDFVLPVGSISGAVVGLDGEAFHDCRLTLIAVELEDDQARMPSNRTVKADEAGRYEFDAVAAGIYCVKAADSRGRSWRRSASSRVGTQLREGLVVSEGAALEEIDFVLEAGGVISGNVTGHDGQPAMSADVRVMTPSGQLISDRHADEAGNFSIQGLGAGTYLVRATRDGRESREFEVRVVSDEESEVQLSIK